MHSLAQAISMALLVTALDMPGNEQFAHVLSVGGTLLYGPTLLALWISPVNLEHPVNSLSVSCL